MDEVAGLGVDDVVAEQRAHAALDDVGVLVLAGVAVERRGEPARRKRVLDEREGAVAGLLGVDHEADADRAQVAGLAVVGADDLRSGSGGRRPSRRRGRGSPRRRPRCTRRSASRRRPWPTSRAAPACTEHWFGLHPLPDELHAAFALDDPAERLRAALPALYGWYRETAPMQERILGERVTVPELDAWLSRSRDELFAAFVDRLAYGFDRALVAVALDFWTWRRLQREGLDDAAAAALMAGVVGERAPATRTA